MIIERMKTVDLSDHATLMRCYEQLNESYKEKKKRIEELKATLKPFADAADHLDDDHVGGNIWESPAAMCIVADDLRAARAAYKDSE